MPLSYPDYFVVHVLDMLDVLLPYSIDSRYFLVYLIEENVDLFDLSMDRIIRNIHGFDGMDALIRFFRHLVHGMNYHAR